MIDFLSEGPTVAAADVSNAGGANWSHNIIGGMRPGLQIHQSSVHLVELGHMIV